MVMSTDSILSSVPVVGSLLTGLVRWLHARQRHALLVRSGLAHRLVHAPPEDALALGWSTVDGEEEDRDATAELDASLGLEDVLLNAAVSARADGGAWLWLIVRGAESYEDPLPPGPHDIAAVHVVTREEARPLTWVTDLESPHYGRPEIVQVAMVRDQLAGRSERVHRSRLVYVPGMRALPSQDTGGDGYDLSVLQVYLSAIEDLERGWSSGAALIDRLSMPQLNVKSTAAAAKDTLGWKDRIRTFAQTMTTRGMMVFFGDDSLTWSGPSVAGYGDLLRSLAERCSVPEGIPLSRLLGQAPGGLSTDDASGTRTYYDFIERYRRTVLRVALLEVYAVAYGPGEREIEWPPLMKVDAETRARTSLLNAQRDQVLVTVGSIVDAESRARFDGPEESPEPVLSEDYAIVPGDQRKPETEPPVVVMAPAVPAGEAEEEATEEAEEEVPADGADQPGA